MLHRLADSESAYASYMSFKQRPLSEAFKEIALMSYTHPNVLCRLCDHALQQQQQQQQQ